MLVGRKPDSSCLSNSGTLRQNPQTLMIAGACTSVSLPSIPPIVIPSLPPIVIPSFNLPSIPPIINPSGAVNQVQGSVIWRTDRQ